MSMKVYLSTSKAGSIEIASLVERHLDRINDVEVIKWCDSCTAEENYNRMNQCDEILMIPSVQGHFDAYKVGKGQYSEYDEADQFPYIINEVTEDTIWIDKSKDYEIIDENWETDYAIITTEDDIEEITNVLGPFIKELDKTKEISSWKERFKEGDRIKIHKRPDSWSSAHWDRVKYPLDLSFPREIVVKEIAKGIGEDDYISICDTDNYGWCYKDSWKDHFELISSTEDDKPLLEIGAWYSSSEWSSPQDYIKLDRIPKIGDRDIHGKENIYQGTHCYEGTSWDSSISNLRKVSVEELRQYLPSGHPDLPKKLETFDLRTGDNLPSHVIDLWSTVGENYYTDTFKQWKKTDKRGFKGHREIKSFKKIDGVAAFLVSGTHGVYLRAEGFKAFKDSFDGVVPEKWCVKIPKENSYVGKWFDSKCRNKCYSNFDKGYLHSYNASGHCILRDKDKHLSFHENSIRTGYCEISQEVFEEHISKKWENYPRDFYVVANNANERDKFLEFLKEKGEPVSTMFEWGDEWKYIGYDIYDGEPNTWCLFKNVDRHPEYKERPISDFIDTFDKAAIIYTYPITHDLAFKDTKSKEEKKEESTPTPTPTPTSKLSDEEIIRRAKELFTVGTEHGGAASISSGKMHDRFKITSDEFAFCGNFLYNATKGNLHSGVVYDKEEGKFALIHTTKVEKKKIPPSTKSVKDGTEPKPMLACKNLKL